MKADKNSICTVSEKESQVLMFQGQDDLLVDPIYQIGEDSRCAG